MRLMNYFYRVLLAASMLLNVALGGPIGQTFSARQHDLKRQGRLNMSRPIDLLLGEGHCDECWSYWMVRKW